MSHYLESNYQFWQQGYPAENVESCVFRAYGRVLKHEFKLSGQKGEKVLDFGCGAGAALEFFKGKGFDVFGVDISEVDILSCKKRMPEISDHFITIDKEPGEDDYYFDGQFDLIIAIQSLYYYSNQDMAKRLQSLFNQMKPGAILYATMMGSQSHYFEHSTPFKDGLRAVNYSNSRKTVKNYYVNFTYSKAQLLDTFKLFNKKHIGYYDAVFREDEGSEFHYTFIGQKPE